MKEFVVSVLIVLPPERITEPTISPAFVFMVIDEFMTFKAAILVVDSSVVATSIPSIVFESIEQMAFDMVPFTRLLMLQDANTCFGNKEQRTRSMSVVSMSGFILV